MDNSDAYNDYNIFRGAGSQAVEAVSSSVWRLNADSDYTGLPPADWIPPTPEQEALELSAGDIGAEFANIAGCPSDARYVIGHFGLLLLQLARKRQPERLPARCRDRLLVNLETARQALREFFGDTAEERMFMDAMDGAFVIANHLSESDAERGARHPDVMLDAIDRLQIAVNTARSHGLEEDIRRRTDRRIKDEVAAIVAAARKAAA